MANAKLPLLITIVYLSIYVLIFIIVSVICTLKVRDIVQLQSKKKTYTRIETNYNDNEDQKYDPEIESNHSHNQQIEMEIKHSTMNKTKQKLYSIIAEWFTLLHKYIKIYFSLILYICDQATDFGVTFKYYLLWKDCNFADKECESTNPKLFFYSSLSVIIFHRIASTAAIYKLTHNWKHCFSQFFDILMIKAIWLNYKLNKAEVTNPQKYLQILETSFESAPQMVISLCYILKYANHSLTISPLIIISLLLSFWSLLSSVAADDETIFREFHDGPEWKHLNFKRNKCPCMSWKYLFRVFVFRAVEITNRVFICVLIWINLGVLALIIILLFELIISLIRCVIHNSFEPLTDMMYLSFNMDWIFPLYRLFSFFVYMILVTIFAVVKFETTTVEQYSVRNDITINNQIGYFMLIYTWITGCIWPVSAWFAVLSHVTVSNERDIQHLMRDANFEDALELIEFGMILKPEHCTKESLYQISDNYGLYEYNTVNIYTLTFLQKVMKLCPESSMDESHTLYPLELECKNSTSFIHLACALTVKWSTRLQSNKLLKQILENETINIDINSKNNDCNTALHYIAINENNKLTDYDIENITILLNNGIDINIKNKDGKTALDIIQQRKEYTGTNDKKEDYYSYSDNEESAQEIFQRNRKQFISILRNHFNGKYLITMEEKKEQQRLAAQVERQTEQEKQLKIEQEIENQRTAELNLNFANELVLKGFIRQYYMNDNKDVIFSIDLIELILIYIANNDEGYNTAIWILNNDSAKPLIKKSFIYHDLMWFTIPFLNVKLKIIGKFVQGPHQDFGIHASEINLFAKLMNKLSSRDIKHIICYYRCEFIDYNGHEKNQKIPIQRGLLKLSDSHKTFNIGKKSVHNRGTSISNYVDYKCPVHVFMDILQIHYTNRTAFNYCDKINKEINYDWTFSNIDSYYAMFSNRFGNNCFYLQWKKNREYEYDTIFTLTLFCNYIGCLLIKTTTVCTTNDGQIFMDEKECKTKVGHRYDNDNANKYIKNSLEVNQVSYHNTESMLTDCSTLTVTVSIKVEIIKIIE